jgi:predicted small secreted protein
VPRRSSSRSRLGLRRAVRLCAVALWCAVGLAACGAATGAGTDSPTGPTGPTVAPARLDGVFVLVGWREDGQPRVLVDPTELIVDTELGSLTLETACGAQLGSFSFLDDGRAGLTLAGGRDRDCPPEALDQQADLLSVLAKVDRWSEEGGVLTLDSSGGDLLTLDRR